jgi:hypothetical protein
MGSTAKVAWKYEMGVQRGALWISVISVWGQLLRWHGDRKWECNGGGVMGDFYVCMGSTAKVAWRWEMGLQRGTLWVTVYLYGVNC